MATSFEGVLTGDLGSRHTKRHFSDYLADVLDAADQRLLSRQDLANTEVVAVTGGCRVVDGDHCSCHWRRAVLPLNPVRVPDRSQVLINHGLVGAGDPGSSRVPIITHAE